ncbi:hypothetical protein B0T11DRAFT_329851 [Plectosphaerella cucumerina]|uniref:BZIP domain-containing protein n=1 Tax=Plectosphaerella cucumerina TaxID=40658 RepID=A0A8K0TCB7_9PEZI|nr:hypothetical protein B0T11DRAFT_329851 [Plectosphaerella cucumerina]
MRHATKTKSTLDVGRREQNRQAQQAFRQRRKLADAAQRQRIKKLEDSVEEMGRMLVGLCDEVMAATAAGDLVRRPGLMDLLRSSISRSLEIAGTASTYDDEGVAMSEPEKENNSPKQPEEPIVILPSQVPPSWPSPAATPFAMRLVETTLSNACLYLSGDAPISPAAYQRAFGPSLRGGAA